MSNNAISDNNENIKEQKKEDRIEELLEKNIKLTEDIHEMTVHIKKYIFWQRIFGFLKLFIILIPIILSIIYLPPLLGQVIEQYQSILGIQADLQNTSSGFMDLIGR